MAVGKLIQNVAYSKVDSGTPSSSVEDEQGERHPRSIHRAGLLVKTTDASGVTFTQLAAPLDGPVVHGPSLHAVAR